jgi:hypothetical protein
VGNGVRVLTYINDLLLHKVKKLSYWYYCTKSKQVDDVVLIGSNTLALKELYCGLEREGKQIRLNINAVKTKYMKMADNQIKRLLQNLTVADYNFKGVREFTYLDAFINDENKVEEEITKRIMSGNRAYFSHIQLCK